MDDALYGDEGDLRVARRQLPAPQFQYMANPQEDLFARLTVLARSPVDAYREAGFPVRPTEHKTLLAAIRLRTSPRVDERVRYYQALQAQRMDVREERIIAELAAVAMSDPAEFFNEDGTPITNIHKIPSHARAALKKFSTETKEFVLVDGTIERRTVAQYETLNKLAALETLSKIKGMQQVAKDDRPEAPRVVFEINLPENVEPRKATRVIENGTS